MISQLWSKEGLAVTSHPPAESSTLILGLQLGLSGDWIWGTDVYDAQVPYLRWCHPRLDPTHNLLGAFSQSQATFDTTGTAVLPCLGNNDARNVRTRWVPMLIFLSSSARWSHRVMGFLQADPRMHTAHFSCAPP